MTSHDVRDMLDLPSEAARPAKKVKISAPRPVLKGLAREVQNLGGDNPIAIVPETTSFKRKRFANRKPVSKWEQKGFTNSARDDKTLVLRHWRKKADAAPEEAEEAPLEDSTFAKYGVQVQVPSYAPEQYKDQLEQEDWTKEETDYLIDLVKEFDLRWPLIWDRYEYMPSIEGEAGDAALVVVPRIRTMEELKQRYYFVSSKMMVLNKPLDQMQESEFRLYELMAHFNPKQEMARKAYCEKILTRTKEEAREEDSLLLELKRILARSETLNEERRELYARLEAPPSQGNIGVYASSQGLAQLLQQLMTADKSKKRKSIMGTEGISPAPGQSGPQQPSLDRRESSIRESISGPSGATNNKKGPPAGNPERRQLTEEEERVYGVSHHERLSASGPAFRHEKISKPITSKSAIQQTKIHNVLTELAIPARLIMPTQEVGELFESLLSSIHLLLEARKVSEKLTGEIAVQKALKEQREEKERAAKGEVEPAAETEDVKPAPGAGEAGAEKAENATEREASAAPSARGAGHKRSVSVLSAASESSTKRQKK